MVKRGNYRKLIDSQFDDLPEALKNQKLADWLTGDPNIDRIEESFKSGSKSYSKMLTFAIICDLVFLTVTINPDLKFTLLGWNFFKFKGINELLIAISTFAFFEFVSGLITAMSLTRLASELTNKAFDDVNPFYVHASLGRTRWLDNVFSGRTPHLRPKPIQLINKAAYVSMSLMLSVILILHTCAIYKMSLEVLTAPLFDSTFVFLIIASAVVINVTALVMFVSALMVKFRSS